MARPKLADHVTTPERKAVARRKLEHAKAYVERAQNLLDLAAQELCPVVGGVKLWEQTCRVSDRCRAHWGKLDAFQRRGRFGLDREPRDGE